MNERKLSVDKILIILAECYVIFPVVIFLWGWTGIAYATVGTATFIALGISLYKSCDEIEPHMLLKGKTLYWLYAAAIVIVWVFLSGIGGFAYQNGDFWARNPIYRDLSTYKWPVVFDFSNQSELVQSICGPEKAAFSYYFCWWLPASFVAKVFNMGEMARNVVLMVWTFVGLFLTIYLLCRKMKRCLWYIPVILAMFSGLDAIPYWISNGFLNSFPWVTHIEFWSQYFQYSSNTTQLFWVFNQSVPVWLLMSLMLQLKNSKCLVSLAAISFAYSPWSTLGMVPYAIYGSVKGKKNFIDAVNVINFCIVLIMICIFGTFYMGGAGDSNTVGFIFCIYKTSWTSVLRFYLEFIFFESIVFFLALGRNCFKFEYYWLTLAELILIPLFVVRDNNFVMRSSIPALFMLMYYVIAVLGGGEKADKPDKVWRIRRVVLLVVLSLGMMTPVAEINRSIINTTTCDNLLEDPVGSFGDMKTTEEWRIGVIRDQFFAYDYGKMPFFKY